MKITTKILNLIKVISYTVKSCIGIKKLETGKYDLGKLFEAGIIWITGSLVLIAIFPEYFNPVLWLILIIIGLIISNLKK